MPRYHVLGVYRYEVPFPADVVVQTLSIIARWLPDFFPAELPVTRKRSVRFASPADYDPAVLPAAFTISPGSILVPIHGARGGIKLEIWDDRTPTVVPASVLVKFLKGSPAHDCLEELMADLILAFQPHSARLTDNETPIEKDVEERRFDVDSSKVPAWFSWVTWLNPGLVQAAGPEALARLSARCHVRPLAGGALVRLQDEPTRGDDPEWSRRRQAAEDAFGLEALHRRFPRNVD